MSTSIEAIYIYDELNAPILQHTYRGRPPAPKTLLSLYHSHPAPRPSLLYLPDASPALTVFSVTHSRLLFLVPSTSEVDPLLVLEFLHRVIDVLEEFVCGGGPLISTKIQAQYDVVAQLLNEMCDGGIVCNTEPNALREVVEVPGWLDKLLGNVGLPNTPSPAHAKPGPSSQNPFTSTLNTPQAPPGPAIPWRRAGVRHTSNELYVDIIESLHITLAPSGRILAALATGSILFTAKISGIPDLNLHLAVPGNSPRALPARLRLPVFHPCVRLHRWHARPGELSFVPPDGRFLLAAYETDLAPSDPTDPARPPLETPFLPAKAHLRTNLGAHGNEFEVSLRIDTHFPTAPNAAPRRPSARGFGGAASPSPSPAAPAFADDIVVSVPVPPGVRHVADLRASRGDAAYVRGQGEVTWTVPARREGGVGGVATLRGTVVGPVDEARMEEDEGEGRQAADALVGYYDGAQTQGRYEDGGEKVATGGGQRRVAPLMPNSVSVSFTVRGWVPSGVRVESLNLDPRRSKGVPETIKPYKGVKYICVSRKGVERRC